MQNEIEQANEFYKNHKNLRRHDENIYKKVIQIYKVLNDSQFENFKQSREDLKTLYSQIEIDVLIIKSGTLLYPQSKKYKKLEKQLDIFMKEIK